MSDVLPKKLECPNCGASIDDIKAKFCNLCGYPAKLSYPLPPKKRKSCCS
jgi:ribosomal protein L37E